MRIILNAPNYKFAQDLKMSAPAGISLLVGRQAGSSPDDASIPAVALLGLNKAKPCEVSREHFIAWLLRETTKDERCTMSYGGIMIEKQEQSIGKFFDEMMRRKNEKIDPNDEASL